MNNRIWVISLPSTSIAVAAWDIGTRRDNGIEKCNVIVNVNGIIAMLLLLLLQIF